MLLALLIVVASLSVMGSAHAGRNITSPAAATTSGDASLLEHILFKPTISLASLKAADDGIDDGDDSSMMSDDDDNKAVRNFLNSEYVRRYPKRQERTNDVYGARYTTGVDGSSNGTVPALARSAGDARGPVVPVTATGDSESESDSDSSVVAAPSRLAVPSHVTESAPAPAPAPATTPVDSPAAPTTPAMVPTTDSASAPSLASGPVVPVTTTGDATATPLAPVWSSSPPPTPTFAPTMMPAYDDRIDDGYAASDYADTAK